jgi:hypothetical protein
MPHKKLIILSLLVLMIIWNGAPSEAIPLESLIPPKDALEGWALIHGPQTYTKKTLFEHINGQAELFLKYGFQKSLFAIYQNKKNPDHQIELDIYDMGSVLQAFGVFSRFRNEDRPMGIGLDSFLDGGSALFYKGRYFVMLYATESNPSLLKEWATKVSLRISDHSPQPKEIGYFPKKGLKPGSIQYFPGGLLGYQFLKRGFQGSYTDKVNAKVEVEDKGKTRAEDKEVKLFLAIFKDSKEAMSVLQAYRDDLSKKGKVSSGGIIEFETLGLEGEDPYQGKVIVLQKGFYLLGVVGFEKEGEGKNRLAEFVRNVK